MSACRTELENALYTIIDIFNKYSENCERMGMSESAMLQPKERRVLSEGRLRQLVKEQLPDMPMVRSGRGWFVP